MRTESLSEHIATCADCRKRLNRHRRVVEGHTIPITMIAADGTERTAEVSLARLAENLDAQGRLMTVLGDGRIVEINIDGTAGDDYVGGGRRRVRTRSLHVFE